MSQPAARLSPAELSRSLLLILVVLVFFSIPFIPGLLQDKTDYGLVADRPAPEFTLYNAAGEAVSLADYRGQYLFLMFGYLNCPDICHSQAILFQEINSYADMSGHLQFLYIAMDPERDSAAQLAAYFDQRGSNFSSLRSDDRSAVQTVAAAYRSYFALAPASSSQDYLIDHAGLFFLIGPDGHLRRSYAAGQRRTDLIVADLLRLWQDYRNS